MVNQLKVALPTGDVWTVVNAAREWLLENLDSPQAPALRQSIKTLSDALDQAITLGLHLRQGTA